MREYAALDAAFRAAGVPFTRDEPMSAHTTFRIGGPADRFLRVGDVETLRAALRALEAEEVPYFVLGNGSNLLVPDEGLRGAVVKLEGQFRLARAGEKGRLLAGAGAPLSAVCLLAKELGLSGLEFAYGIPGSLGGALFMNAGAYGGEMRDAVERVFTLEDGAVREYGLQACEFSYRHSAFMGRGAVILGAELRLSPGEPEQIGNAMETYMARRKEKQPLEMPSAGSVFKRPEGYFAGALIEACGLKGLAVGGAEVSEKHAGFIVNRGGATCEDVERLIGRIRETVLREKGVLLEPELQRARLWEKPGV